MFKESVVRHSGTVWFARGGCPNALLGGLLGSPACFHARLPWPPPGGGGGGVDGTVPAALANGWNPRVGAAGAAGATGAAPSDLVSWIARASTARQAFCLRETTVPRLFEAQRDPWRGWMDAPLWPSFLGGHGATPAGDEGPWGGLRDRWKGFAKYLRYRRPESLAHWGQSRASTAPILGLGEGPHGRYHCLDGLSSPANWRTAIPYRRWSTGDNESLKPAGTAQHSTCSGASSDIDEPRQYLSQSARQRPTVRLHLTAASQPALPHPPAGTDAMHSGRSPTAGRYPTLQRPDWPPMTARAVSVVPRCPPPCGQGKARAQGFPVDAGSFMPRTSSPHVSPAIVGRSKVLGLSGRVVCRPGLFPPSRSASCCSRGGHDIDDGSIDGALAAPAGRMPRVTAHTPLRVDVAADAPAACVPCQQALTAPPSAPLTIGAVALRIAITYVQSYFDKFAPLTKQNNAGLPYQGRRHSRRGLAPVSGMNNTVTAQQRPGRPAMEREGGAAQGEPSLASLPPSQPLRRLVLGRDNGMWDWDCFTLSVNRRCMAVADPSTWRAMIVLILSGTTPGRQERVFLPSLSDSRPLVLLGLGPISTAGMAAPAPHTRAFSEAVRLGQTLIAAAAPLAQTLIAWRRSKHPSVGRPFLAPETSTGARPPQPAGSAETSMPGMLHLCLMIRSSTSMTLPSFPSNDALPARNSGLPHCSHIFFVFLDIDSLEPLHHALPAWQVTQA
ncbi:hypothetical protein Purlil1_7403 [Purpureocillium lilacinum]|uniref:Uncharacterized protein n=1 Tax=Purpureocillium lilacinum TaxID=33203 RepID=A0ABR0BW48_PURLI|nr:hypothetical protein Purlil1_7403 [Purpureocillium lilacinum]